MASETQCPCTHSEGDSCVCEVTAPCAKDSENRTVEWTANCGCEGGNCCAAKFTIKCGCETSECGTSCCEQEDKEVSTFNVKCGDKNCQLKVKKCKCCTVTLVEGGEGAGGCCGAKSEGCCKE